MKTTALLPLISLAAVGAAEDIVSTSDWYYTPGQPAPQGDDIQGWKQGVYNASGKITIPGYQVNSADIKTSNWTFEARLLVDSVGNATTNFAMHDEAASLANITRGWSMCSHVRSAPRKSADAVDATCKGILDDNCIAALKAAVATHGNCSTVAPAVCGPGVHFQGPRPLATNATTLGGFLPHGGLLSHQGEEGTKQYDEQMKEVFIVAMGWDHNGTDKDLASSVSCFGYTDVQPGSRSMKEVFSAAPLPSFSWAVAGLALLMAL